MFGYIKANIKELKVRELERYRSFYCGLCDTLRKKYGLAGQATLSYDVTFLVLFLSALYELPEKQKRRRCLVHPMQAHLMTVTAATSYAADMEMLLTFAHLEDDWADEKKVSSLGLSWLIRHRVKKVQKRYKGKTRIISEALDQLHEAEKRKETSLDAVSDCFGRVMACIFSWRRSDLFKKEQEQFGFYLGKFIYLMDAYDDYEKDLKSGSYNVFHQYPSEEKRKTLARDVLSMTMAQCADIMKYLPITWDSGLLENIIYMGVWNRLKEMENGGTLAKGKRKSGDGK